MRASAVVLGVVAVAVSAATAAGSEQPASRHGTVPSCSGLTTSMFRTVVSVIDGETIRLDDGQEVRLAGALAPRATDVGAEAGTWKPETEAHTELKKLVLGKSVELAFHGTRGDRYGRLLAQVFVREGRERHWLQGHLVAEGYARAYGLARHRACGAALLDHEGQAREAQRGLWAEAAYRVRAAVGRDLEAYRGSFQVLQGRVARVAIRRGSIYLNFERHRRGGFSASLRAADKELLGTFAYDPRRLIGRDVRLRGWIEGRRWPAINLSAAGLMELVDGSTNSGETLLPR